MADQIIIDLPEFGGVEEWREALAELTELNSDAPDVKDAIARCELEIAALTKVTEQVSAAERWHDHGITLGD